MKINIKKIEINLKNQKMIIKERKKECVEKTTFQQLQYLHKCKKDMFVIQKYITCQKF